MRLCSRAAVIGIMAAFLVLGGIVALLIAYALPPCSLETEPLLRQLGQCR